MFFPKSRTDPCWGARGAHLLQPNCSSIHCRLANEGPFILIQHRHVTPQAKGCNWYSAINGAPAGAGTQFAADYAKMIATFKALPSHPKVFVVLPPPGISQCAQTGPAGSSSVCLA